MFQHPPTSRLQPEAHLRARPVRVGKSADDAQPARLRHPLRAKLPARSVARGSHQASFHELKALTQYIYFPNWIAVLRTMLEDQDRDLTLRPFAHRVVTDCQSCRPSSLERVSASAKPLDRRAGWSTVPCLRHGDGAVPRNPIRNAMIQVNVHQIHQNCHFDCCRPCLTLAHEGISLLLLTHLQGTFRDL